MSRGVRIRLAVFVVLSAIGITYVAATYLGIVDRATGRNIEVTATLPGSGGLFEGSEVTYRGVKIGRVSRMTPTEEGVEVGISLEEDTKLPVDSEIFVHNLSAVGSSTSTSSRRRTRRRTPRTARPSSARPTRSRSTRVTSSSTSTGSSTPSTTRTCGSRSRSWACCSATPAATSSACSTTARSSSPRRRSTPTRRSRSWRTG